MKREDKIGITRAYGADETVQRPGMTRGTEAIAGIDPWVEAGVSPKTLLQAMTINAAKLMGVEKERGLLREGLAADIIAVPDNPLENINTLKKVSFVMKNGVVIKRSEP